MWATSNEVLDPGWLSVDTERQRHPSSALQRWRVRNTQRLCETKQLVRKHNQKISQKKTEKRSTPSWWYINIVYGRKATYIADHMTYNAQEKKIT